MLNLIINAHKPRPNTKVIKSLVSARKALCILFLNLIIYSIGYAASNQLDFPPIVSDNSNAIKLHFKEGVKQAKQGNPKKAITIFLTVIDKHPNAPEVYNNLAAMYADIGELKKAEAALIKAISIRPYFSIYNNLSLLHTKMASQSYQNILTNSNKAQGISHSITLSLFDKLQKSDAAIWVPAGDDPTLTLNEKKQPVELVLVTPNSTDKKPFTPIEPQQPQVVSTDKGFSSDISTRDEILTALNRWSSAWSQQQIDAYLSSYGNNFTPPKKASRAQWEKQRSARLSRPKFIKVTFDKVNIDSSISMTAIASFVQHYRSDTYSDTVQKRLTFNFVNGAWLIVKEAAYKN